MEPLHDKLKRLAGERELTQAAIVRRLKESISSANNAQVSRWFNGHKAPDLNEARALAAILGVGFVYLVDDYADEPEPGLTPEERIVLDAVREVLAEGMTPAEAIRRLVAPAGDYARRPMNFPPHRGSSGPGPSPTPPASRPDARRDTTPPHPPRKAEGSRDRSPG